MIEATPSQNPGDFSAERLREIERLLEEKEAQLRDRDRTVQELTKRLTQSAERLDRVRRVGSDGPVIQTAAFPKEVVEQQSELVEDLQRAVQLWENMQLGCGLGGLQMQLADLQSLFEEHFREKEPPPEPIPADQETPSLETGEPSNENAETDSELAAEPGSPELLPEEVNASTIEEDEISPVDDVCPLRPPEILTLADAKLGDLQRCVEQQDAYIDYLTARLQRVAEKTSTVDWDDLAGKPEKLKNQLEHTAKKLLQSRHLAEFELALQRTRLKRKERELKKLSDDLAGEVKSADLHPDPDTGKETPGGRRWMRMLGMGKNESE
jgi:hypothetical protein